MNLLKDRFSLNRVSASIVDIVRYPWASVYTTNYDNGLKLALQDAGKRFTPLNNTDDPQNISSGTPIIHLHGFAAAWTDANFEQSCVLDANSYRHLSGVSSWLDRLRFDIERAEVVIFLGFSAADFHLSQVFFNASGLREKAFFINRPASDPDPDERTTQEDFGESLYVGREDFAEVITETLRQQEPIEPQLASFSRYLPPQSSSSVPRVQDIEDLFVWGRIVREHLKRDHDLLKSDYHVRRGVVEEIQAHVITAGHLVLLHADICDGKTLVILDVLSGLPGGRPAFELRHPYTDLLSEVSSILLAYPNAVFVVENCFSLREDRLLGLARQVAASEGSLILSARSISTEGETGKLKGLRAIPSLIEVGIGQLKSAEIDALIVLIDQIAGWRDFRKGSAADRRRFIEVECKKTIPNVLLRLLNSEYIRARYLEEYNKISYLDSKERQMIVAALLIANLGIDAPTSFLSDVFEKDFAAVLRRISIQNDGLRLIRIDRGLVRTIPSIGARNLLKSVVERRDIVNTTIYILESLADKMGRSDFEQHIFSQLMRYSILSSSVSDPDEINRFFDHTSKVAYFRNMPLFWLQWHMAMCAQGEWLKAEEYLDMGATAADAYEQRRGEKYNKKQLEDRRAKFLAARAISTMRSGVELFRDLKEALDIVGRLMRESELTHHPYETLFEIAKVLQARGNMVLDVQYPLLTGRLKEIVDHATRRLGVVPEGYQRSHAAEWIRQVNAAKAADKSKM